MRERLDRLLARLARFERRELRELRRWLARTSNLLHLSVLFAVPLLIGVVTALSNVVGGFSFLLFPPLASGAYTLFANPEGEYASPLRFVAGLSVGAACGWAGIAVGVGLLYPSVPGEIHAAGAALSVLLTGAVTWLLDVEEPAAFSTALLTLFVDARIENPGLYVLSVAVGSAIVAGGFLGWRRFVYERRAAYLYESVSGDDHVLVPIRGEFAGATTMLGARLAAAHRAGKVVLLDVVPDERAARTERSLLREHGETRLAGRGAEPGPTATGSAGAGGSAGDAATHRSGTDDGSDRGGGRDDASGTSTAVAELEQRARTVETRTGVPCEVLVAAGNPDEAGIVVDAARRAGCDLVATPYESEGGGVSEFVRGLFGAEVDVLVHRSADGREGWTRILVPVRGSGGVAHSAVDFAVRLAGSTGQVTVGTCIGTDRERRRAKRTLADLVGAFEGNIETRVSLATVEEFLTRYGPAYDLVILGASRDRSAASRFVSRPTFERIDGDEVGTDIAILDRR